MMTRTSQTNAGIVRIIAALCTLVLFVSCSTDRAKKAIPDSANAVPSTTTTLNTPPPTDFNPFTPIDPNAGNLQPDLNNPPLQQPQQQPNMFGALLGMLPQILGMLGGGGGGGGGDIMGTITGLLGGLGGGAGGAGGLDLGGILGGLGAAGMGLHGNSPNGVLPPPPGRDAVPLLEQAGSGG